MNKWIIKSDKKIHPVNKVNKNKINHKKKIKDQKSLSKNNDLLN